MQKQTFLKCVSKGFIRGCSSLSLLKCSKFIAGVTQIDPKHMGEASVGSSTDTSELIFCSITYLRVDGSFDMSWMVSCCI